MSKQSDDFFLKLMQESGLVRVVAADGSVWWVKPEDVESTRKSRPLAKHLARLEK